MMRPIPFLICVAAALPAAELVERDLRVSAASRPLSFSFTEQTPTASASGSDAFDAALALEVGGRWSVARPGDALGLILGVDFENEGYTYSSGGTFGATGLRGVAGLGWAARDRLTLYAEVAAIWGQSAFDMPDSVTAPAFTASGTMTGYDLRLGGDWMTTRRFGIGMHAGWLSASHQLSGSGVDLTLNQSGWYVGLETIWRFTDAPTRLE